MLFGAGHNAIRGNDRLNAITFILSGPICLFMASASSVFLFVCIWPRIVDYPTVIDAFPAHARIEWISSSADCKLIEEEQ